MNNIKINPRIFSSYSYQISSEKILPESIILDRPAHSKAKVISWTVGIIATLILSPFLSTVISPPAATISANIWFLFFIGFGATYALAKVFQHQANEEWKVIIAKEKTQTLSTNAQSISTQLNQALSYSIHLVGELPELLWQASNSLEMARQEYSSNAFSPYWDFIEQAAGHLATFNKNIQTIRSHAVNYYATLQGKAHNFPSFLPDQEPFPDPTPLIENLNKTSRLGLTNYQFANIWEQRRTQKTIVEGFRTLGDAISNMADSLCCSIGELRSAISSDNARIVEQQITNRDTSEQQNMTHVKLMNEQVQRLESIQKKLGAH